WLGLGAWAHFQHVVAQLRDAARIAGGATLVEEPHRTQRGIGREALIDQRGEWIQLLRAPGRSSRRDRIDLAIELPGRDPVMNGPKADAELLGDVGLVQTQVAFPRFGRHGVYAAFVSSCCAACRSS